MSLDAMSRALVRSQDTETLRLLRRAKESGADMRVVGKRIGLLPLEVRECLVRELCGRLEDN